MRLTEKKLAEVNEAYRNIVANKGTSYEDKFQLNVGDGFGATVFSRNWGVCKVEDLNDMISALLDMKQAIEEATGIC